MSGPGPIQVKVKPLKISEFAAAGLLGIFGFLLLATGSKLSRPSLLGFSGGFSKSPKTLQDLQEALYALAPGPDSLTRASVLAERGWSAERTEKFEALKGQVSAQLYSSQKDSQEAIEDLLKAFQSLRKGRKS